MPSPRLDSGIRSAAIVLPPVVMVPQVKPWKTLIISSRKKVLAK